MEKWISSLENILKLSDSDRICSDASVLTCGCFVSESNFVGKNTTVCSLCQAEPVSLLNEVAPLRLVYKVVQSMKSDRAEKGFEEKIVKDEAGSTNTDLGSDVVDSQSRRTRPDNSHSSAPENLNLMGLFYRYAKEEEESLSAENEVSSNPTENSISNLPALVPHELLPEESKDRKILDEDKERNFSQCFPFHRKISTYNTQPKKFLFDKGFKLNRFVCTAISRGFDDQNKERVVLCLVSEKKWELYVHTTARPVLLACGKMTGEYGRRESEMKMPSDYGFVVRSDYPSTKSGMDQKDVAARLKSSVLLYCALSERYLVLSGTRGVLRILNIDPSRGEIGAPVYTYLTNFPIRCIALAPDSNILACGITTREKLSGKQQPFIILHHLETSSNMAVQVSPITITVPFRDPLKLLTFNATSTHLLCCTVYEMRYFLISLRNKNSKSYKEPRLVFSDTRAPKNYKERAKYDVGESSPESADDVEDFMGIEDDDRMLDNEGITDIKFGTSFSNTIVITSSSLKKRSTIVLRISGYSIDARDQPHESTDSQLFSEVANSLTGNYYEDSTNAEVEVLMKVPEIGSNIYGVESSPRGDGMVFVDKLGRLLLVSTPNAHMNFVSSRTRKSVVLLGEVAPALRSSESASVCFSFDGGKVYTVDRKGVFQVFDFTKGLPGVDPEVLKCKIISI